MSGSAWGAAASGVVRVCWGAFVVVWIAGAVYNARRAPVVRVRGGYGYAWVVGFGLAWVVFRLVPGSAWRSVTVHADWLRGLGMLVLVAATGFTLWARVVLGTMWSSSAIGRERHELRTDGPYRLTRHPIYTGILGMVLGTAVITGFGPWGVAFVIAVIVLQGKIHAEEKLLRSVFPDQYETYRRRVPQLVPGLRTLAGWRR